MKRLLLFTVVLVVVCSACAMAQTWNWALSGGYNPTQSRTVDGQIAWGAFAYCCGAGWESVPTDTGTALRLVDTVTDKKVQWQDYLKNVFKENASSGMTVAFRIKFETSALTSGSATTYTIAKYTTQLLGAPCRHKFQLSLKNDATLGHCLINNDYGNGLDGTTPVALGVEDHQWHTFRLLLTAAPDGSNNGRYQVYWDGVLVQDYKRYANDTFPSEFGTDASANVVTYQLDYFGVSVDGAWTQQQLADPSELYITSGPTMNLAPDKSTATITWQTNEPAHTSMVHYGDAPKCPKNNPICLETATEPGGPSTNHSVTIPVGDFKYTYWYVESTSPTAPPVRSADFQIIDTGVVQNMGFENATQDPWVTIPGYSVDGIASGLTWGVWPHYGNKHALTARSSSRDADRGGYYQIISGLTPGRFYEVSAWIWTKVEVNPGDAPAGDLDCACRVGIDPTAGTFVGGWNGLTWVENPNITWSPWAASDQSIHPDLLERWKKISCAVKATSTTATIYIQQQHRYGYLWNITSFDDVWVTQAPPPPAGIGATKAVKDGFPAFLPDKIVTASWPAEKRFYVEEEDRSSAIKVTVPEDSLVPAVGAKATVSGAMTTNQHGDRVVAAVEVIPNGTADVPGAVCMNNKAVGEKTNSGLLVKVLGKVLENPLAPGTVEFAPGSNSDLPGFDPYGRYYMYIDDGSGVPSDYNLYYDDPTEQWMNLGLFKGVKVYYHPDYYMPQVGEYVICTGIAGYELCDSNFISDGGNFSLVRTLEMRQTLPVDESSIPKHLSDLILYPAGSY